MSERPLRIVSAAQMRALDRVAGETCCIPSRVLMENAGRAVAEVVRAEQGPRGQVLVVCGTGNNGGDGLVAARHLTMAAVPVKVLLVGDRLRGDARENLEAFRKCGGAIEALVDGTVLAAREGDVVVDALFGTGLTRAPEGLACAAIEAIRGARKSGARVVAVDLPSGLDSDSGRPPGNCVEADVTVTFAYWKLGLVLQPGAALAGRVIVADISLPKQAEDHLASPIELSLLDEAQVRALLPRRVAWAHKGDCGHVLVVAGSPGKTGAATMACAAALRGGAGLVTLVTRANDVLSTQVQYPEIMSIGLAGTGPLGLADLSSLQEAMDGKSVVACGPGLFCGPETADLLEKLLSGAEVPWVLDADALNVLSGRIDAIREATAPVIMTPHPKEMARFCGVTTAQIQDDRIGAARRLADQSRAVVVLKGSRTVVAVPGVGASINPTGNAGMATGGCGDVLTGLTAALVAQGMEVGDAACAAVFVHGLAGDRMGARTGMRGLVATDLLEGIAEVWAEWRE